MSDATSDDLFQEATECLHRRGVRYSLVGRYEGPHFNRRHGGNERAYGRVEKSVWRSIAPRAAVQP
jgi:hypothetical protein